MRRGMMVFDLSNKVFNDDRVCCVEHGVQERFCEFLIDEGEAERFKGSATCEVADALDEGDCE